MDWSVGAATEAIAVAAVVAAVVAPEVAAVVAAGVVCSAWMVGAKEVKARRAIRSRISRRLKRGMVILFSLFPEVHGHT